MDVIEIEKLEDITVTNLLRFNTEAYTSSKFNTNNYCKRARCIILIKNIFVGAIASLVTIIPALPIFATDDTQILTTPNTYYFLGLGPDVDYNSGTVKLYVTAAYKKVQTIKHIGTITGQERVVRISCRGKKELRTVSVWLTNSYSGFHKDISASSKLARWDKRLNPMLIKYACNQYNQKY